MKFLKLTLFAGCVLAIAVGTASANLNSKEVGAVLFYPEYYATSQNELPAPDGEGDGTHRNTYITVTNSWLTGSVNAHFQVIGATACDDCSFDVCLTPYQSKRLIFTREEVVVGSGNYATVIKDATQHSSSQGPLPTIWSCDETRGFVVAYLEAADQSTCRPIEPRRTLANNYLYGDDVVVDILNGSANQVGAIAVKALTNDGDRWLEFDNIEYEAFPNYLAANFYSPNAVVDPRLILFNVDINTSTVSDDPDLTSCSLTIVDAEENHTDDAFTFGCWTDTRLLDIGSGFHENILGTANGFLVMECDQGTHGAIQTRLTSGPVIYPYSVQSDIKDTLFQSLDDSGAILKLTPAAPELP